MIRAGKLNHRVTIQRRPTTRTKQSTGEYTDAWEDVATVWAEVAPIRGTEQFQSAQFYAEQTYRIRLRYRRDITTRHRLTLGARAFDIESVANVAERSRELEILAKEAV